MYALDFPISQRRMVRALFPISPPRRGREALRRAPPRPRVSRAAFGRRGQTRLRAPELPHHAARRAAPLAHPGPACAPTAARGQIAAAVV
eukprot:scaffold114012_cov63-Phaeocystis_antarctica.AAC.1